MCHCWRAASHAPAPARPEPGAIPGVSRPLTGGACPCPAPSGASLPLAHSPTPTTLKGSAPGPSPGWGCALHGRLNWEAWRGGTHQPWGLCGQVTGELLSRWRVSTQGLVLLRTSKHLVGKPCVLLISGLRHGYLRITCSRTPIFALRINPPPSPAPWVSGGLRRDPTLASISLPRAGSFPQTLKPQVLPYCSRE